MKKFIRFSLVLAAITLTACTGLEKSSEPKQTTELVILHANDTHGRILEGSNDGMGYSRIDAIVEDYESKYKNVLYLDAGDTLHGTVMASLDKGESMVKVLNETGVDATVPGNHDYNYGIDRLVELSKQMNFPVLAANVVRDGLLKDKLVFDDYIIKDIDGYKIGIFGLSTPETAFKTNPKNIEGIKFLDPVETAKKVVKKLKKEKVDYIIALVHLGLDQSSEAKDRSDNLAKMVPEIDLIIDGHSHTVLPNGLEVNGNYIVQTGEYDKNLGKVVVTLNPDGTEKENISLIDKKSAMTMPEDPDMIKLVKDISVNQAKITETIVGKTDVKLVGDRAVVRTGESNLADYLTDAMLWKTGADIALTNGGGIRSSIDIGDITRGEVIQVLPFGNYVIVQELTGADVIAALENGTAGYPSQHGAFAQVSGIKYSFDPSKPIGQRIVSVTMANGESIDKNKTYKVATNDFIAAGGDLYVMFKGKKVIGNYEGLDEILTAYIASGARAKDGVDGRVKVIN